MEQFNQYFLDVIKKNYADFNGKATRSQYWYFVLFYLILLLILKSIDTYVINPMLGMTASESLQGGFLQIIFGVALLIPSLAIGIRRLHDIGKSGWWLLIGLVPFLGIFVLLYFFVQESNWKIRFGKY